MLLLLGVLLCVVSTLPRRVHAAGTDDFVITVKTDNTGTSNSTSFSVPADGGGFNYSVDWNNDGTVDETGLTTTTTHDFGVAGTYTIRISGTFPRVDFNYGGDRLKLISVDQWGTGVWDSFDSAFFGCTNMHITATDAPVLTNVTTFTYAFRESGLTNEDLHAWNMSHVQYLLGIFQDTAYNGNVSTWDTSAVSDMSATFYNDTAFNQDISAWNTSNVATFSGMFYNAHAFNKNIGGWNTVNATDMSNMFFGASSFDQNLSSWKVSRVMDLTGMFSGATLSTTHYDALLNAWASQWVNSGLTFDAGNSMYSCASAARTTLAAAPNSWTITDGGQGAACPAATHHASSRQEGTVHYGCKDPSALNYEFFAANNPALCRYGAKENIATSTPVVPFARTLRLGDTNDAVRVLQSRLNALGFVVAREGPGSKGKETNYFGAGTFAAVKAFQRAHAALILSPLGLSVPTGVLGERTRSVLNQLP